VHKVQQVHHLALRLEKTREKTLPSEAENQQGSVATSLSPQEVAPAGGKQNR
jgi:hypothetical protein